MAKDINLLPDITLNEEKETKRQKLLTVVSMAILIVGIVGVLVAFTIDITLGNTEKNLIAENDKRKVTIRTYAEVETMQRTIKAKLGTAANIIKEAKDYKLHLEHIQSMLPDSGITIQSIAIDKLNKVTLSGKANNSVTFNQYIANILSSDKGGKYFDDINLGSVSTAQDGTLQFNLTMSLKKGEVAQ